MNFIGKHIQLIGILLLAVFVGAAAGLYFDLPARLLGTRSKASAGRPETDPMDPDVVTAKPGGCPMHGIASVSAGQVKAGDHQCGDDSANHPGCCANKGATPSATALRLPPAHPPIPGWPANTHPESAPAPSNHSTNSSP